MVLLSADSFACVPCEALDEKKEPVLGSVKLAQESPLPLGLAVIVADEDRSLPIFFLNEVAANRRSLDSGWYAMSEHGKKFYLKVTNFHEEGKVHFRGKKLEPGEEAGCELLVNGRNVQLNDGNFTVRAESSEKVHGFAVEWKKLEGSENWVEVTKDFRFQQVKTTSNEVDACNNTNIGHSTIELRICRIELGEKMEFESEKMDLPITTVLNEQLAKKRGLNTQIAGDTETFRMAEPTCTVESQVEEGCVNIFVRERWWLQAKNIIDPEGNAWRPKVDTISQEIKDKDEHCDCCVCKRKKQKNNVSSVATQKKPIPMIDLTVDE